MGIESSSLEKSSDSGVEVHEILLKKFREIIDFENGSKSGKILRACTLAALTFTAACSAEAGQETKNGASSGSGAEYSQQDSRSMSAVRYRLKQARERNTETADSIIRARQIGSEMDLELGDKFDFTQEGLVITEINGVEVPASFHTEQERQSIENARQIRGDLDEQEKKSDSQRSDANYKSSAQSPEYGNLDDF